MARFGDHGVFHLSGALDSPEEVEETRNGLHGAEVQRRLRPALNARGWDFEEAVAEDYGWVSTLHLEDQGKKVKVSLAASSTLPDLPEEDSAPDGNWDVVLGMDGGMLPKTKARRKAIYESLRRSVEESCVEIGGRNFFWHPHRGG